MLNVLITIDTETYPLTREWKQDRLTADLKRDLYGEIDGHAVGLEYQLKKFAQHGLKANFMLESLYSAVPEVGPQPLRDTVRAVLAGGHDIQLHPHTEWIRFIPDMAVPYRSDLLRVYPLAEQEAIIRHARSLLEEAGSPPPVAFRAGGFAANADTFLALNSCGIRYDTSYNRCYRPAGLPFLANCPMGHAIDYSGVLELPVTVFRDFLSHSRPAQLCACSYAEMVHALTCAEKERHDFFIIVSHSFEMIARRRHPRKPPVIRWNVVERFERLCQFLSANRDRFPTVCFSDLDIPPERTSQSSPQADIHGKLRNTAARMAQQAASRFHTR